MLDIHYATVQEHIFAAMDSSPQIWQTIDDIAEAASVSKEQVALFILETELDILESNYRSAEGKSRYSTISNFQRNAPWWVKLRGALCDSWD